MTVDPRTAWIITLSVTVGILFALIYAALCFLIMKRWANHTNGVLIPVIILAILAVIFIIAASAEIAKLS